MAEVINYRIANGTVRKRQKYFKNVHTQFGINRLKIGLFRNLKKDRAHYDIVFTLRFTPEEVKKNLHRKLLG